MAGTLSMPVNKVEVEGLDTSKGLRKYRGNTNLRMYTTGIVENSWAVSCANSDIWSISWIFACCFKVQN